MVGSPYQTSENLADDLLFIKSLNPQMIGIGPFISHHDTPFKDQTSGSLELTLFYAWSFEINAAESITSSTTALGTIS